MQIQKTDLFRKMALLGSVLLFVYTVICFGLHRFVEESTEVFDSASSDPASDFNVQM
jgi:hypothetical protein